MYVFFSCCLWTLVFLYSKIISAFPTSTSGSFVSTWVKYYCTYHREPKRVTMVLFDPKSGGKTVSRSGKVFISNGIWLCWYRRIRLYLYNQSMPMLWLYLYNQSMGMFELLSNLFLVRAELWEWCPLSLVPLMISMDRISRCSQALKGPRVPDLKIPPLLAADNLGLMVSLMQWPSAHSGPF